jgi:hypothetical protein
MSEQIGFKKLRETATTVLQGDYPVVVDKVTYKRTQTDKPMWTITFKVTAGPYTNRAITHFMTLNSDHDFLVKRFFQQMEALGADAKFFDAEPSTDAVCAQIQGRHAVATLKEGEFRGEKREEVEKLTAAGTGTVTVATTGISSGLPQASTLPKAATIPVSSGDEPPADPF